MAKRKLKEFRKFNNAELKSIIEAHNSWHNSHGVLGHVANLSGADLSDMDLSDMFLGGADLSLSNLRRTNLSRTNLFQANLYHAELRNANLTSAMLGSSNLSRADLSDAILIQTSATRATLSKAILNRAQLIETDLSDADLTEASLMKTCLVGASLTQVKLRLGKLNWADLTGCNLTGADLSGGDLRDAILKGANLVNATLTNAKLSQADLSYAMLSGANLSGATLDGANFDLARCSSTNFADLDLSNVKNLEYVKHLSPSTVGIDTLMKTKGQIPKEFMAGCGVPESVYEYSMSAIRALSLRLGFYSAFISYHAGDDHFSRKLHDRLRAKEVRVWFAPEKLRGGSYLEDQIDKAIAAHEKLLIVISAGTLDSEWVKHEIEFGHAREVRERREQSVLFPIRLVSYEDTLRECAKLHNPAIESKLRRYFIPDFTEWETDEAKFTREFDKLLDALKKTEDRPS